MTTARQSWQRNLLGAICLSIAAGAMSPVVAQEPAPAAKPAPAAVPLSDEQMAVAEKFKRFEAVLLRMAELTAATDPKRAALLRQAVAQSKDRALDTRFESLVKFLQDNRLALAVTNQDDVQKELQSLLELLLTENREERLLSEQARVKEYLKRVNKLIKDQKSVQGQTNGAGETKPLADKQGKIADDAGKLAKDIKTAEEGDAPKGDQKPAGGEQGKPGEKGQGKPGDKPGGKPEDKPKEGDQPKPEDKPGEKPAEGDKPAEPSDKPMPGEPSKPSEGKPSEGKPMPGKPMPGEGGEPSDGEAGKPMPQEEQPPADEGNPARKRIEAAQEKMKQAKLRLEEAKRKDAADEQEKALRELEQAKAELEKILRQMREEQLERMLAALEARFRKMLVLQVEVYEGTLRLDKVPLAKRDRSDEIEAGRLSRKESVIALEAEKALALLREEGTAVAMPEAVTEMHEDMQQTVLRLAQNKVDERTQGLEEDIIAGLEEMIEALQKAQKDLEDQKPPPPGQQGPPGDKPLIDQIAELKMIRSLQLRVNRRTQRYADMIEGKEQAVEPDLIQAIGELGEREQRIFQATKDIATGKNQ